MECPICNTESKFSFTKELALYSICPKCGCCFTKDKIVMDTQNEGNSNRNEDKFNSVRLNRILNYSSECPDILDFGCGNGQFVNYCLNSDKAFWCRGIDQNTDVQIEDFGDGVFDVINCVEVIEHLINPIPIVEEFYRVLNDKGIVYLETTFIDRMDKSSENGYINPRIGHVLIHSKKSIEILFKKFKGEWINNSTIIFKKV